MKPRSKDFLALLLLFAVATVYFGDVLGGSAKLYLRDLTRYYYPTKKIIRDVVLNGEFPYWNRLYSAGQPLAANPEYEVFYPPQWLILLPDYDLGYRLHILFHVYLALGGMYCLLRSMRLRIESALFGSLCFGMGGLFLSLVNLLPQMFCTAWMPLIFLFARRFLLTPNRKDFALTSLFLGAQALAGEPMTMAQTGFLIGAYGLYRAWYSSDRQASRIRSAVMNTLSVAAMGASAVIIGAAQMIPALDHARDSVRSRPFDFSLVTAWSMPFIRPLEMVFPNVLGHLSRDRIAWYWAGGLYPGMGSPFLFSVYAGVLAAALIVGGIFVRPRGGRFVLLVSAFSILLALGSNTPLFKALYHAGVASSIRYPEKFALIALFTLIVFASMMFERLISGDRKLLEAMSGFLFGTTLFSAIVAVICFTPLHGRFFTRLWGPSPNRNLAIMLGFSRMDWLLAAAKGIVLLVLLWGLRSQRARHWWTAALLLFVLADVTPVTRELIPRMEPQFFAKPPLARKLPANPATFRIFHEADWYGTDQVAKDYFSTADAVYWIVRNGLFPMTTATWGYSSVLERDYDKTALLPTVDLVDAMWLVRTAGREDWREIFASMSNASYRAQYRPFVPERTRVRGNMKKADPVEMIGLGRHPRYYFSDQLVAVLGPRNFVKQLSTHSFSRSVAFVDFQPFKPAKGVVNRATESANDATISVHAEGKAYLVMSVTPHKYWSATIDGVSTPLHTTNLGYQGIVVPKGEHLVKMRYRNTLVPVSAAISLLGIVAFGMTAARYRSQAGTLSPPGSAESDLRLLNGPVVSEAPPDDQHVPEHPERIPDDPDLRI